MAPSTKTESVREQVFDAILHGEYLPGDAIPAEREMAEITGTSRITVRRAYAQLEKSGILERRQGRGTTIRTVPQGRRHPIAKMARTAIELLARQQRLGYRWSAQRVRLKGKLVKE